MSLQFSAYYPETAKKLEKLETMIEKDAFFLDPLRMYREHTKNSMGDLCSPLLKDSLDDADCVKLIIPKFL